MYYLIPPRNRDFAYKAKCGIEDATIALLNPVYKHVEIPSSYMHILFADFTSAFNSIVILAEKMIMMGANRSVAQWIQNFLTGRQQYVRVG